MVSEINPYIRRAWYDILHPNVEIGPRVLLDHELLLIRSGKCSIQVEDRVYRPKAGDIFLFRPNQLHSIKVDANTVLVQPHIHFDLYQLPDSEMLPIHTNRMEKISEDEMHFLRPDTLGRTMSPPDFFHPSNPQAFEQQFIEVIYSFANRSSYLDELRWRSQFLQLLYMVLYEMQLAPHKKGHDTAMNSVAQRVKIFLDNNTQCSLSLDEIATRCYVSKYYMVTAFKSAFGVTPHRYHMDRRINESKYLLRFSTFSISEIAAKLGFEHLHSFSTCFKHYEHMSPTQYRELVLQQNHQEFIHTAGIYTAPDQQ